MAAFNLYSDPGPKLSPPGPAASAAAATVRVTVTVTSRTWTEPEPGLLARESESESKLSGVPGGESPGWPGLGPTVQSVESPTPSRISSGGPGCPRRWHDSDDHDSSLQWPDAATGTRKVWSAGVGAGWSSMLRRAGGPQATCHCG